MMIFMTITIVIMKTMIIKSIYESNDNNYFSANGHGEDILLMFYLFQFPVYNIQ